MTQTSGLWTRRRVLFGLSLTPAMALVACAGGAASPTSAPTAEATKPAAATTAPAATKPATGATTPAAAATTTSAATKVDTSIKIAGPFDGEAKALTGAGATFPAVLYTKWFDEYFKATGVKVNYQSIGSGGGIKSISDQTVDFGATDGPMSDEQMSKAKGGAIFHVPMALGAVVPTYNIPELEGKGPLKFTGETLPGIFLGEITKWNDPKLVADNPDLQAIDKDIVVVHRSDGSGTTFIFVDYLSHVSEKWKSSVGVATSVNWPVGLGGKGNEGVAGEVKQNPYALGYVELIYAVQNKLGVGYVKNRDGNFIEPRLESVTAAAAGAAATTPADLRASIVNAPGANAYPISGFTWQLVYEQMADKAKAIALTRLLWCELTDAQKFNAELGYAPLPEAIAGRAQEMVKKINVDGAPAFPGK